MSRPPLMRDSFIKELTELAKFDKDIYFLSSDFGAAALDEFRELYPDRFIHTGISEQNMVDLGAGLAIAGKKVFLYAMAPFLTARCYEQIKAVVAAMNLPITFVGVGVGLGYDHATLTHFTPEDIASMRALNHVEILTMSDAQNAASLARKCVENPAFRYIRLDRQGLPDLMDSTSRNANGVDKIDEGADIAILGCGIMTHQALKVRETLAKHGKSAKVLDIVKIKPLHAESLLKELKDVKAVLTLEEQMLEGGFSSAIIETMMDNNMMKPVKRLGIKNGFEVVNGSRDDLHKLYEIDTEKAVTEALALLS